MSAVLSQLPLWLLIFGQRHARSALCFLIYLLILIRLLHLIQGVELSLVVIVSLPVAKLLLTGHPADRLNMLGCGTGPPCLSAQ